MNSLTGYGSGCAMGAAFTAMDIWLGTSQMGTFVILALGGAVSVLLGVLIGRR